MLLQQIIAVSPELQPLPLELRHKIYSCLQPLGLPETSLTVGPEKSTSSGPLLQTCKQLLGELEAWFTIESNDGFVKSPRYGLVDPDQTTFILMLDHGYARTHCCGASVVSSHNTRHNSGPHGHNRLWNNPYSETPWCWHQITLEIAIIRHLRICLVRTGDMKSSSSYDIFWYALRWKYESLPLQLLDIFSNLEEIGFVLG
jgi:hypothetical protein